MSEMAEFQEGVRHLSPLVQMALVMGAMFFIPKLVERFGIPGLIGLILAGMVTGPLGLGIFKLGGPIISVFAELGADLRVVDLCDSVFVGHDGCAAL